MRPEQSTGCKQDLFAILLHNLNGGGVQQTMLHLADEWQRRGWCVEFVVCRDTGPMRDFIPAEVGIRILSRYSCLRGRLNAWRADPTSWRALLRPVLMPLKTSWHLAYLPALSDYLAECRPRVLYTSGPYPSMVGLWARRLAGTSTRIVVSERVSYSHFRAPDKRNKWRWRYLPPLLYRVYREADGIVANSMGTADELAYWTGLSRERIRVIYNPVVTPRLKEMSRARPQHPWLRDDREAPVVLTVGRLVPMKDHATLLRAFARLRAGRPVRLLILGEGKWRSSLRWLAAELGVTADVDMPGWTTNPYAHMAHADLFVLSSREEGFGNVLVEALACGCPVVATDCPSGPAEILDHGRYGTLVPPGDDEAMAKAMAGALDVPVDASMLAQRAATFSQARSADEHLKLFENLPAARDIRDEYSILNTRIQL